MICTYFYVYYRKIMETVLDIKPKSHKDLVFDKKYAYQSFKITNGNQAI